MGIREPFFFFCLAFLDIQNTKLVTIMKLDKNKIKVKLTINALSFSANISRYVILLTTSSSKFNSFCSSPDSTICPAVSLCILLGAILGFAAWRTVFQAEFEFELDTGGGGFRLPEEEVGGDVGTVKRKESGKTLYTSGSY